MTRDGMTAHGQAITLTQWPMGRPKERVKAREKAQEKALGVGQDSKKKSGASEPSKEKERVKNRPKANPKEKAKARRAKAKVADCVTSVTVHTIFPGSARIKAKLQVLANLGPNSSHTKKELHTTISQAMDQRRRHFTELCSQA